MHPIRHITAFITLLLLVLGGRQQVWAASFRPLLFNYTTADYGSDASLQNWDITQDADGVMFIANNSCVLRYDGFSWQHIDPTGAGATIRSICSAGRRIYIGLHEELGFLEPDAYGNYHYEPLISSSLSHSGLTLKRDDEVWNICRLQSGEMVFQTFSAVYVFDGTTIRQVNHGASFPLFVFSLGDDLYIQAAGGDLLRAGKGQTVSVASRSALAADDVMGISRTPDGRLLAVTTRHGIFSLDGHGQAVSVATEADALLTSGIVNRVCTTRQGLLVVGTIREGVVCIGNDGRLLWHYDTASGLNNDCVLRLLTDADDNVWVCMDNGVALVANGSPYTCLTSKADAIGMVYGLNISDNNLYIATNQGVYRTTLDCDAPMTMMSGTEGQNWHLTLIGNTLFAGNNVTTLMMNGGHFAPLGGNESSTCMRLGTDAQGQPFIIESTYARLHVYRQRDGQWQGPDMVEGFRHPLRQIATDADGTLWGADMNRGVYHIRLSRDLHSVEYADYYGSIDSLSARCFVTRLEDRVVFNNGRRLYVWQADKKAFEPFDDLNRLLPDASDVINIVSSTDGRQWVCGKKGYTLLEKEADRQWHIVRRIPTSLFGLQGNDVGATVFEYGDCAYFNLSDAIVCFNPTSARLPRRQPALRLHKATFTDLQGSHRELSTAALSAGHTEVDGNLTLQYSYPLYLSDAVEFRFTVSGPEVFTVSSREPVLHLPNLHAGGAYEVTTEVVDSEGNVVASDTVSFTMPRPWYLRWWALLAYMMLIVLCSLGLARYFSRRQLARQHLKMLQQERIIAEQQKQLLEAELQVKSKNLAAISLEAMVKHNVINSISESIRQQQKQGLVPKNYLKAELARIRQTAGDDASWNLFMQNFDLIHEHFFRNLKQRYPQLTMGDLKLCGLLRLNLSTKEIASYTHLSIRGVESARLRLRRKLGLTGDQSLVEFLVMFTQ